MPNLETVKAIQRIAWAASCGSLQHLRSSWEELHKCTSNMSGEASPLDPDDAQLCRESLEVLALSLALAPSLLDTLNKEKSWHTFIIDMLLFAKDR